MRAETVIPAQIDYFTDSTHVMGHLMSPTVFVDFEADASQHLQDSFWVALPP